MLTVDEKCAAIASPRVTEGLSFADYLRIDAVNIGSLCEIEVSPKRYRHRLTHPKQDTSALRRGRAGHTLLLQPHLLESEYAIMPAEFPDTKGKMCEASRRLKSCQLWCEEQEARDLTILTRDELASARELVGAVLAEPFAMELLQGTLRELTLEWTDPGTGIRCKGRLDAIRPQFWIWDLKTTRNPVIRAFERQSADLFYHAKMSWYQDAATICGLGDELPVWMIVVGAEDEHDVVVYDVQPEALDAGRLTYSRWLDRLAECRATNRWPGVSGGQPIPLNLPPWAVPAELRD